MSWLAASILLSVVLTIVLNVVVRAFPGAGDAAAHKIDELTSEDDRRVRVWIPWKGMLIASLALTVLVNLVLLLS